MEILIRIKNRKVRIILSQGKEERDFVDIENEKKLSEDLLFEIDKLIKRNNLEAKDILKILVETDQEDNFTTPRIAKAVANAWNFGLK